MVTTWKVPGWTWLKSTAEVAGVTFTVTLCAAWTDAPDLASINWHHVFSKGAYEAVGAILYGVLALRIPNGTFSRIRNVVAKDKLAFPESGPES
jgi:hypothetical protein